MVTGYKFYGAFAAYFIADMLNILLRNATKMVIILVNIRDISCGAFFTF